MAFKTDVPKLTVLLGVILLLSLDVVYGTSPGVGIQDVTGDPIWVHCQSKDTNFDPRTMQNNQIWSWYFSPDFGGSTLFWCDFAWRNMRASFNVWDINIAPIYDLSVLDWKVAQDGFTLYDPVKGVWNHYYDWHPAPSAQDSTNSVSSSVVERDGTETGSRWDQWFVNSVWATPSDNVYNTWDNTSVMAAILCDTPVDRLPVGLCLHNRAVNG